MHQYILVEQKSDTSVTAEETKKLIACLELHSRLMGEWDFQFLSLLLFSMYLFACWDRYAGQMPREMWCIIHSSYSLGFPWWEVRSRSWNVIPSSLRFVLMHKRTLCADGAGSGCMFVCAVRSSLQWLSLAAFWLQDGISWEGECFLLRGPTEEPQHVTTAVPWAGLSSVTLVQGKP